MGWLDAGGCARVWDLAVHAASRGGGWQCCGRCVGELVAPQHARFARCRPTKPPSRPQRPTSRRCVRLVHPGTNVTLPLQHAPDIDAVAVFEVEVGVLKRFDEGQSRLESPLA